MSRLCDPDDLRAELIGLEFLRLAAVDRDVVEGRYHSGRAAVVQVLATGR